MKKRTIILLFILAASVSRVAAQQVYVNTISGIYRLTGGVGSSEHELVSNGCGPDFTLLSIAVYKDTIYYTTWAGELKRFHMGSPGNCETLISGGPIFNSLTVDKDGILYMANSYLVRYDPHTREKTEIGLMPVNSGGDMIFYKGKLLLAGWDPYDWSTGIFELNLQDLSRTSLYMETPEFIGLLAYPSSCGHNRYFGLSGDLIQGTIATELDLDNKTIGESSFSIPETLLDAASSAEQGLEDGVSINSINKTAVDNCGNSNGSITLNASSLNAPLSFTMVNTGQVQKSGYFGGLRGGLYRIRITNAKGCSADTTVAIAENIPAGCNDLHIPNAFTPNHDGKNDLFTISFPAATDLKLQVFNRWGAEVYAGKGSQIAWDGTYRGLDQPTGVYVYTLTYTVNGSLQARKGTITLIR